MKALIYKDLVALKKTGLLSLVILAVVCFIGIWQEAVLMLPFIFVLVPVILLGILFGSDTQSRVDSYIIPGPVKRCIESLLFCLVDGTHRNTFHCALEDFYR